MKYYVRNDHEFAYLTSNQGEMVISYGSLVALFGEPMPGDGYKTQAEWILQFEDGTCATIYDWKEGDAYLGEGQGIPATEVLVWHIGGRGHRAYQLVVEACKDHLKS